MINGHTVQQNQVQNLFHSVQLNVNNPHFLIMQGRITKVLNMKPPETLSMIEEAAGTRMFETKKQAALKTIEKKQQKVDELTRVIEADIDPKLSQLRGERQNYLDWSSNNTELERLERFCTAADYKTTERRVHGAEEELNALTSELNALKEQQAGFEREAAECKTRIEALEAEKDSAQEGGSGFQELKRQEQELSKELVKITTTWSNQSESLSSEQDNLKQLHKQIEQLQSAIVQKTEQLTALNNEVSMAEAAFAEGENKLKASREAYQNAVAGKAEASNAELLSLPEQILTWEKAAREAESALQQRALRTTHANDKLKELKKSIKAQQSSHGNLSRDRDSLRSQVQALEERLTKLGKFHVDEAEMRSNHFNLSDSVARLTDRSNELSAQLEARLNFDYATPERGFDRNRVKGPVAKLIQVPDRRHATALEIVAGPKLFQIVVDSEQTGKLLLTNGKLKKRVTIMPLNKISNRCIESEKVQLAKRIAAQHGGNAYLALELVQFDEEVRRGIEFVFGNTIICDNQEIAKLIAFDRNIRTKTVTLDGDSYDPSGTVTGGSKNQLGQLLARIAELNECNSKLAVQKAEINAIEATLSELETSSQTLDRISVELETKKMALKNAEERLGNTTFSVMTNEIDSLEQEIQKYASEESELRATIAHAKDELKKLQVADSSIKKKREQAMDEMKAQVSKAQKVVSDLKSALTAAKHKRDNFAGEISSMQSEVSGIKDQIDAVHRSILKLGEEVKCLEQQVALKRGSYEAAKEALVAAQAEIARQTKEIKQLSSQRDKAQKAATNASLEARKQQHKLDQCVRDSKDAERRLADLVKKHPWIATEKAFFGVPGGAYDFSTVDMEQAQQRLRELKASQDRLSKKVNKKVMGMIEKAEQENEELKKKRDVILKDKAKIEAVIEELDVKKNQALQTTWVKVNRDFGSIFSTLLPGTSAKLEPLEGCPLSDGLEVRVAFNNVWKESLTELSGGQRSLLALSLILSLLLFKPAPMYILDEVDAALDLSHTQNIGLMLRTHFSSSQFIVVSLKEGMFNNANVIFRTRFVDGVSAVTRTVAGGAKSAAVTSAGKLLEAAAGADDEEGAPTRKRGKILGNATNKLNKAAGRSNTRLVDSEL
jgi:structural maintenance of chromosome 2